METFNKIFLCSCLIWALHFFLGLCRVGPYVEGKTWHLQPISMSSCWQGICTLTIVYEHTDSDHSAGGSSFHYTNLAQICCFLVTEMPKNDLRWFIFFLIFWFKPCGYHAVYQTTSACDLKHRSHNMFSMAIRKSCFSWHITNLSCKGRKYADALEWYCFTLWDGRMLNVGIDIFHRGWLYHHWTLLLALIWKNAWALLA